MGEAQKAWTNIVTVIDTREHLRIAVPQGLVAEIASTSTSTSVTTSSCPRAPRPLMHAHLDAHHERHGAHRHGQPTLAATWQCLGLGGLGVRWIYTKWAPPRCIINSLPLVSQSTQRGKRTTLTASRTLRKTCEARIGGGDPCYRRRTAAAVSGMRSARAAWRLPIRLSVVVEVGRADCSARRVAMRPVQPCRKRHPGCSGSAPGQWRSRCHALTCRSPRPA